MRHKLLRSKGLCNSSLHLLTNWRLFSCVGHSIHTVKLEEAATLSRRDTMVEEETVGIKCFITSVPGFRGILKQRYSDFIVNEVDLEGNVVHLSCLDAPVELTLANKGSILDSCGLLKTSAAGNEETEDANNEKLIEHLEEFKTIVSDTDVEAFRVLLVKISEEDKDCHLPLLLSPDPDKSHRTVVHNFFKGRFSFIVSDTVDGPDFGTKCVRIRFNPNGCGRAGERADKRGRQKQGRPEKNKRQKYEGPTFDSRGTDYWPVDQGKYLRFHLYKENKDTQDALNVIGRMLHVQPKSFGIAGTKDKRAITTQRVTVFKQAASRLAALNSRLYGMKVGDFCYVGKGLALGQLSGNRFTIILRDVVAENDNSVRVAAQSLGMNGFINYFGLQRFGTSSVPTFMVGAALLRGEWKNAVDLILQPREGERTEIHEARKYFMETKDADGAFQKMPRQLVAERAILTGLRKYPGNFLQSINHIPRTVRMMYVHSYQSYLWNHAATKRIQLYGVDKVVEGDIVYCKDTETAEIEAVNKNFVDHNCNMEELVDGADVLEDDINVIFAEDPHQAKHVTADDLVKEKYTIEDVLLPLPGSKTLLPTNDVATVYTQMASQDSIELKGCTHNVKEYSFLHLPGGYRHLIQIPKEFDWKILRYSDPTQPLVETDIDRVTSSNRQELTQGNSANLTRASFVPEDIMDNHETAFQTAALLKFTLPASCYATMAVRELTKTSSSVSYHKALSKLAD